MEVTLIDFSKPSYVLRGLRPDFFLPTLGASTCSLSRASAIFTVSKSIPFPHQLLFDFYVSQLVALKIFFLALVLPDL